MSMNRRLGAEVFGTFWLTFGGCGSAVLAAYGVRDCADLDFLHHPQHFDEICNRILSALDQRDLFLGRSSHPEISQSALSLG